MAWSKKEQQKIDANKPITYSQEIADRITEGITDGKSLRSVLKEDEMPVSSTVYKWLREHKKFERQYVRACEERTEAMAEDIVETASNVQADSNAIQKARLEIDTKKWLMSKQKPKKYGDKLDLTSDGKVLPTPIYGGKSGTNSGSSRA